MVVVLVMSAVSIDVAQWYQKHHQAQVAADAAALAAANCLANAGNTGDTCTSTTDTTDAFAVARSIASANGISLPASDVSFPGSQVDVTAPATGTSMFARMAGIQSVQESAKSAASFASGTSTCSSSSEANSDCYMIFAGGPNATTCSGSTVTFGGGGETISGAVHSNGTINGVSDGGDTFNGPVTYGTGCAAPFTGPGTNYNSAGSPAAEAPITTWPMDYSTVFPACSATGKYQCTGPDGTPSYCSVGMTGTSETVPQDETTSGVWCAYGTGTPSNPATWTGNILITGPDGSSTSPYVASYIGGSVSTQSGGDTLAAYDCSQTATSCTYPLFYLVGTGTPADFSNGGISLYGAIFCPNGSIDLGGGGNYATFLEAENVTDQGGGFRGIGPVVSGSGGGLTGTDQLIG
jgi:hypothetical protein